MRLSVVVFWVSGCLSTPPADQRTTGSPSVGSPTLPTLPDGWSEVRVGRPGVDSIFTDGATTWALDWEGGVLDVGAGWLDLGVDPLDDSAIYDAALRGSTLWAVTFDTLGWFAGTTWTSAPLPEELTGPRAVVARADGTVAVLNIEQPIDDCYYDCGPSASNVLGSWDGANFTVWTVGPADPFDDLVETASGDLVAVGGDRIARWDGSDWEEVHRTGSGSLQAVVADGDGIVAVGHDGLVVRGPLDALTEEWIPGGEGNFGVDVSDDGVVWALGYTSAFVDDGGWAAVPLPVDGTWSRIDVTAEGPLLIGQDGGPTVMSGGVGGWSVDWHEASLSSVQGVLVDTDGTTWLAAHDGIGRWDETGLVAWQMPGSVAGRSVRALSGAGEDIVGVGGDGIYQWNGDGFDLGFPRTDDGEMWDVSVAPDGSAFVASSVSLPDETSLPRLLRRDAGTWTVDPTPIPTPARALMAVQAFAANDVYALTWKGPVVLLHFDGASWTELTPDLGDGYESLWGRSNTDLYLGGSSQGGGDPLLHWDGASLTPIVGGPANVRSIAGTDTALIVSGTDGWGDAWAPVVSRWENGVWTELLRNEEGIVVGAGGETVAWADEGWVQRGPLASW